MDKNAGNERRKGKGVPSRGGPLSLLPPKIWVMIAARVGSASIRELFNMQATCNVFWDAARSTAVYKVASMAELPIAFGDYYDERPEWGFLYRCEDAKNPAAIFHTGMTEFFWIGRQVGGMNTLVQAANAGNIHACYFSAMLILTPGVGHDEHIADGLEMYANVRATGKINACRELFGQVFANPFVGLHPLDPRKPVLCKSSMCPTWDHGCRQCSVECIVHPLPGRVRGVEFF
ncbi:uncharacterized protein LOC130939726 [Arachis stenosperma]|uniref:uncharacterized protein LOC130939726 n=1 Tax=Arachis stenosperma TaxID=217475 RepID=UPI0025ABB4E9|nr:uncharacterized protein LOC130939726 [Arachis stenosperma]